jgi:hypothetical protein
MSGEPDKSSSLSTDGLRALRKSHPKSLNGMNRNSGRATSARIYGRVGSVVAFFDDQQVSHRRECGPDREACCETNRGADRQRLRARGQGSR